ncbi:hypothetical protein [Clostridium thermarum]|uniref:hypothetical protein n=1 Tax=Clostridium thermarum TaxID=1716543 RepID=UPI0013D55C46|nr:hypothetical protein [Clostridium thermarum]
MGITIGMGLLLAILVVAMKPKKNKTNMNELCDIQCHECDEWDWCPFSDRRE